MATAKPPEGDPGSGFSDEQKKELATLIAEAVAGAKPPDVKPPGAPQITDDQWEGLNDKQRERWVTEAVHAALDKIAKDDHDAGVERRLGALEQGGGGAGNGNGKPPAEQAPTFADKLRTWFWGKAPADKS